MLRRRGFSRVAAALIWIPFGLAMATPSSATGGLPYCSPAPTVDGIQVFPDDNIWNTRVDTLPVHPNSSAYVASVGADAYVHSYFGSGTWLGDPIGIPHIVAPVDQGVIQGALL